MKRYVFEVTIEEGNCEFWEDLEKEGLTGVDEVLKMLRVALCEMETGNVEKVKFLRYEDDL